ncbi:hypothetical protein [Leucobacter sp.]
MNASVKIRLVGSLVFAALAAMALVLAWQTFVSSGPGFADPKPDNRPDLAVLESEQNREDVLPTDLAYAAEDVGQDGIQTAATRYLGKGARASYWAALDNGGNVCLLFRLPAGVLGHACGPATQFNREGVAVAIEDVDNGEYLEARLLPDRADPKSGSEYLLEVPNVIAISPSLRAEESVEIGIAVDRGEPIRFGVLGEVPRDQL